MGEYGGVLYSMPSLIKAISNERNIYAFITFLNHMYVFDRSGNLIEKIENIDFEHFSTPVKKQGILTSRETLEMMTTYSTIRDLFWKNRTTLLIQYWRYTQMSPPSASGSKNEGYMSFAEIDTEGNVIYEKENTRKIWDYRQSTDSYFLLDSLSLESEQQNIIEAKR